MSKVEQVGGDHYQQGDKPQHWDLVSMYQWDYFQGQITKYVMRWKRKNGLQDLEKARSFLDKYIEEYQKFYPQQAKAAEASPNLLAPYETSNPHYLHDLVFLCEGGYGDGTNLYTHRESREKVRATSLQDAHEQWAAMQPAPHTADRS